MKRSGITLSARRLTAAVLFHVYVVLLFFSGFGGCSDRSGARSLDEIKKSGKLIVATRNSPTTYYVDRHGEMAGFEYEMVASFAEFIGVEPEIRVINTISGILDAVQKEKCNIGAAGLTHTAGRSKKFLVGPVYQRVKQLVIARRGGKRPRTVKDLTRVDLHVVAGSSHEERLRQLKKKHPALTWKAEKSMDAEGLLEMVWRGEIECTVTDDNIFRINRRYYPELLATMAVTEPEDLAWFLNNGATDLRAAISDWFEQFSSSGALKELKEKYYGYVEIFDYVDTREFARRIESTLPKYRPLFEQAGKETGLDWMLLAAQSYQESHWRPSAQSPTGVKGIMMLTLAAAEDLDITNRLDPEQSILGGARYLRDLIDRLPAEIEEPDRTWIALAAYNVGMGHMYDARALALRLGKDPNLWLDMQDVFPLLSHEKYYQTVNHGYARGSEPVRYVSRIRNYEDILRQTVD